jgi:hypothetical protein
MPSSEARIDTDQPGRYLAQLCQHASHVGGRLARLHARAAGDRPEVRDVSWTDTDGTLRLSWGTCTLTAAGTVLTVRADAETDDDLHRLRDLITADLERFGRRAHLTVDWQPA